MRFDAIMFSTLSLKRNVAADATAHKARPLKICTRLGLRQRRRVMAKLAFRFVVCLCAAAYSTNLRTAQAQTYSPPPHFEHVVIIIQENRTPDDLFGGDPVSSSSMCGGFNGFTQYIDLANGGENNWTPSSGEGGHKGCSLLTEVTDLDTGGANHSNEDWQGQWDNGAMDGACNPNTSGTTCGASTPPPNPPYVYVEQSVVQPYFDIANNYGWGNYMFQTNEGPSYPAHQFLFGGTSAPVWPSDMYANYFVADNPGVSGCNKHNAGLQWVDPTGDPTFDYPTPSSLGVSAYECYDRNTMVTTQAGATGAVSTRIDKASKAITWKYYAQTPGKIWDAPESDPQTCYGSYQAPAGNPPCSGPQYTDHVIFPGKGDGQSAPILTDIASCKLAKLTWVTPDAVWSDHPGDLPSTDPGYPGLGPSWVTDIIDAIGQSNANSGGQCDYWQASPTAIFVVWDDWGGFYDHVPPPAVYRGTGTAPDFTCSAPNGWGCGYVYGFRVPLLVVSPYTTAGTVSGALNPTSPFPPPYPPNPCWTHDFGSILAFTEQNFYTAGNTQIAPSPYTYADSNSLDRVCQNQTVVPMWEFFNGPFRAFTPISAPYSATYFENYYNTPTASGTYPQPTGPDNDGDED
jgi:phospholipase C